MQNTRFIIISLIGCFLFSFFFLAYSEKKTENIDAQNFWFLSFSDPKNSLLSFNVENHTANDEFHWELLADKNKLQDGDLKVEKGKTVTTFIPEVADVLGKRISIKVTAKDNSTKDIYKTF